MTIDLYQEELKIEAQARQMGVNRFHEDLTRKVEGNQESNTFYGSALLRRAISPMIDAIEAFKEEAGSGKAGRRHAALKFLKLVPSDVAAFVAAKAIIDTYSKPQRTAHVAGIIGRRIEDEVRYADFQEQAPGLWNVMQRQTAHQQDRQKRTVLMHTYHKHVAMWEAWKETDHMHLGVKLLELFVSATGFAQLVQVAKQDGKYTPMVQPTPEVVEWMERSQANAAELTPAYMPMVVKPEAWDSPFGGGYISPSLRPLTLIKTRNRAYLEELSTMPTQLKGVYEAVNALQEVPWRVNKKVQEVMNSLWSQGSAVAGLPQRDETPVPPYPFPEVEKDDLTDEQKETVKDWKRKATVIHGHNAKLRGKRIQVARTLGVANQFSQYPEIFFPHTLDFRGRVYAVPMFLNPQGNDVAKGLLEFGEGKPIGETTGPGWLAIHGANVFGYDKANLEDRIDWVEERSEMIEECAKDPLGKLWWTEADKPWSFLAFCFEWASFLEHGGEHITRLPIALDGSCSGLQHFSAALRDEVGGKAVNLVPGEKPSDVYQEVADLVVSKLRHEVSTSGSNADLAGRILDFGVDRGTCKRSTMTLPYGSTRFSCRTFVAEWIDEAAEKKARRKQQNPLDGFEQEAASLLGGLVWDSIGEVVIAAREAMNWLRDAAKVLSKEELPLYWTTPDGLPIMQEYRDQKSRRVKTRFGDRLIYLRIQEEQDKLDSRRQANGVAPNWVHSMDATHLRMAILYGKDNGINSFAVIHDSFGTHACDSDLLGACLRESMVDLYQGDVLEEFRSETCEFLPTSGNIPTKPAFGNLDLNQIKESDYVFA